MTTRKVAIEKLQDARRLLLSAAETIDRTGLDTVLDDALTEAREALSMMEDVAAHVRPVLRSTRAVRQ